MATYMDATGRYRILRNDMPTNEIQAKAYEMQGIDPATTWVLLCSFDDEADAEKALTRLNAFAMSWQTFKIEDAGEPVAEEAPGEVTEA